MWVKMHTQVISPLCGIDFSHPLTLHLIRMPGLPRVILIWLWLLVGRRASVFPTMPLCLFLFYHLFPEGKNWCLLIPTSERALESPFDCKEIQAVHPKGDQSWVFIEGLMLKLKLQYFGHLMQRVDSLEKTLMLGGIGGRRRRGWQRMR